MPSSTVRACVDRTQEKKGRKKISSPRSSPVCLSCRMARCRKRHPFHHFCSLHHVIIILCFRLLKNWFRPLFSSLNFDIGSAHLPRHLIVRIIHFQVSKKENWAHNIPRKKRRAPRSNKRRHRYWPGRRFLLLKGYHVGQECCCNCHTSSHHLGLAHGPLRRVHHQEHRVNHRQDALHFPLPKYGGVTSRGG